MVFIMTIQIHGKTNICAVIGDPVGHSLSPCMHNAAFQATGLDYVYVAFHVKNVEHAAQGMRGFQIRGLSVTIPHKVAIMNYLDEITPLAKNIGAVNTVTNEGGKLIGTNTDAYGALRAIEDLEQADGKTIAVLGVGGAARAVAFALACERKPKQLFLLYRAEDETMANSLQDDIQPHTEVPITCCLMDEPTLQDLIPQSEIVIHTTPVGMHPHVDACLVEETLFSERHVVFDIIYNPAKTRLLQRAENRGARIINGIPMFVYQGAEQFRLWTGVEPPVAVMDQAVKGALGYR
jgi:shikimate dehydrogenase